MSHILPEAQSGIDQLKHDFVKSLPTFPHYRVVVFVVQRRVDTICGSAFA